jgi:uncharacterized protein with von Willebrand factor type A (vWA) domain
MDAEYVYRPWDGSQEFTEVDADGLLAALADDLLENGDVEEALERLLRQGFEKPDGEQVRGLRDILEEVRQRRRELEERGDPDGQFAQYADQLKAIEALERAAIDELDTEALESGDDRRIDVTSEVTAERRMALDLLPGDVPGRIQSMQHYDFVSTEAREQFEQMVEELRKDITDTYFQGMADALGSMDDEALGRMRDALDSLNELLEMRADGKDTDEAFSEFMEEFGDLFPGAENLDDLLEQLANRMAAAQAMWNSMSPEQRAHLSSLMSSLMDNADLNWQMDRLSRNLERAFPDAGWDRAHQMRGMGQMSMAEATDVASQLNELGRLEEMLERRVTPSMLSELDIESIRRNLSDDAARHLEQLSKLAKTMQDAGVLKNTGGKLELTAQGIRALGRQALADLFDQIRGGDLGDHQSTLIGTGHDREETTKPYEFGDPMNLDLSATVHNAVRRSGRGTPVRLSPDDFEVVENEALTRSATVLCLDLSLSMGMRGNFVPAKRLAMALSQLVSMKFPRDYFAIVGFSLLAYELKPEDVATLALDDNQYGTNLQHALMLSRKLLAKERGTKQIIVITDGEPTSHIDPTSGLPYFNYPPLPYTQHLTMAEVLRCTRAGITINTFALDLDRTEYPFVEQISRVNKGRTFYTTNDQIGGYALVDFLKQRRLLRPAG